MNGVRAPLSLAVVVAVLAAGAIFARSTPAAPAAGVTRSSVVVAPSRFGRILFDGRGFVLYAFTRDGLRRATCYGKCAKAWPPAIVSARPVAGAGASGRLVGVVRRSDGSLQATYAGRPLYYYVGDSRPGLILCQNVLEYGGYWRVVRADGSLVS
jgi:predicted lipoprotein with Yx(FWY)xxD motif